MNRVNLRRGPDIKPLQAGPEACKVPMLSSPAGGQAVKASVLQANEPKINLKDENEPWERP